MTFHVTVNVPRILSSALAGVLIAYGLLWVFGADLDRYHLASAVAFVIGQAACLWVLYRSRDRHPADRTTP